MTELHERLIEEDVLLEKSIPVESYWRSEGALDDLEEELFAMCSGSDVEGEISSSKALIAAFSGNFDEEAIIGKLEDERASGIFWLYTTPVRSYPASSDHFIYSTHGFGFRSTRWVYAENREEADALALKWFERINEKWKAAARASEETPNA